MDLFQTGCVLLILVALVTAIVDVTQQSPAASYVSSLVEAVAYAALVYFLCRCSQRGIYNTGVVFVFWILQTLVALTELRSQVIQDVRNDFRNRYPACFYCCNVS